LVPEKRVHPRGGGSFFFLLSPGKVPGFGGVQSGPTVIQAPCCPDRFFPSLKFFFGAASGFSPLSGGALFFVLVMGLHGCLCFQAGVTNFPHWSQIKNGGGTTHRNGPFGNGGLFFFSHRCVTGGSFWNPLPFLVFPLAGKPRAPGVWVLVFCGANPPTQPQAPLFSTRTLLCVDKKTFWLVSGGFWKISRFFTYCLGVCLLVHRFFWLVPVPTITGGLPHETTNTKDQVRTGPPPPTQVERFFTNQGVCPDPAGVGRFWGGLRNNRGYGVWAVVGGPFLRRSPLPVAQGNTNGGWPWMPFGPTPGCGAPPQRVPPGVEQKPQKTYPKKLPQEDNKKPPNTKQPTPGVQQNNNIPPWQKNPRQTMFVIARRVLF